MACFIITWPVQLRHRLSDICTVKPRPKPKDNDITESWSLLIMSTQGTHFYLLDWDFALRTFHARDKARSRIHIC